jgi:hypothetical protein
MRRPRAHTARALAQPHRPPAGECRNDRDNGTVYAGLARGNERCERDERGGEQALGYQQEFKRVAACGVLLRHTLTLLWPDPLRLAHRSQMRASLPISAGPRPEWPACHRASLSTWLQVSLSAAQRCKTPTHVPAGRRTRTRNQWRRGGEFRVVYVYVYVRTCMAHKELRSESECHAT